MSGRAARDGGVGGGGGGRPSTPRHASAKAGDGPTALAPHSRQPTLALA